MGFDSVESEDVRLHARVSIVEVEGEPQRNEDEACNRFYRPVHQRVDNQPPGNENEARAA